MVIPDRNVSSRCIVYPVLSVRSELVILQSSYQMEIVAKVPRAHHFVRILHQNHGFLPQKERQFVSKPYVLDNGVSRRINLPAVQVDPVHS